MTSVVQIRKSPAILIRNLIILQFIELVAYFLVSLLADYGTYYNQFSVSQIISYQIARFLLFLVIEAILVVYIFLRWFLSGYLVYPTLVIKERGVVFKHRDSIPLTLPVEVSAHEGIIGRLFGYGTISLRSAGRKEPLFLTYITNPNSHVKSIKSLQNESVRENGELKIDLSEILKNREDENLEFKSTLRWDMRASKVNQQIEKAVLKTVAAFLNSGGGRVVIGMGDNGEPHGLEYDYATLKRPDTDGFENHFTNIFNPAIGPELRSCVKLSFHKLQDKDVCVLHVFPGDQPAYVKFDNEEAFYIRTGNSTTVLPVSQVVPYIRSRWEEA